MISIKISQIPTYLRDSELFRSLNQDDPDECIQVPRGCYEADTSLRGPDSLRTMLSTVRYWCVRKLPRTLVQYLLTTEDKVLPVLSEFDSDLKLLDVVTNVRMLKDPARKAVAAATHGQPDILRYLLELQSKDAPNCFLVAAHNGHVACMTAANEAVSEMPTLLLQRALEASCAQGYPQCVQLALQLGAAPSLSCVDSATQSGCRTSLSLLHKHGAIFSIQEAIAVAKLGHYDCLRDVLRHCPERSQEVCDAAAESGDMVCLQAAYELGCEVGTSTLTAAARCGNLECLKFAAEHGAAMDVSVSEAACQGGHMYCVLYAIEQWSCPVSEQCTINAARQGHLYGLIYLHEVMECALDEQVFNAAAAGGHLSCLEFVYSRVGMVGTVATTAAAAGAGSVKCLDYLLSMGCAWDHTAPLAAAGKGSEDCLAYMCNKDWLVVSRAGRATNDPRLQLVLSVAHLVWILRNEDSKMEQLDQDELERNGRMHANLAKARHLLDTLMYRMD